MQNMAVRQEGLLQTVAVRTGCGSLMTLTFDQTETIAREPLVESALRVIPEIWVAELTPNYEDDLSDTVPAIGRGSLDPFQLTDTGDKTNHLARYHEADVNINGGQRIHFFCLSRLDGVSSLALRVLNKAVRIHLSQESSEMVQLRFFGHLRRWAESRRLEPYVKHPVVKFRW